MNFDPEVFGALCRGLISMMDDIEALQAEVAKLKADATPPPNADDIADRIADRLEPALAANTRALRAAGRR